MRRARPKPAQVAAALEFQSIRPPRTSRLWRVHWTEREPTIKRYQTAVPLSRVLADHRAAVAAEPMEESQNG